jgi:hypothetical protein
MSDETDKPEQTSVNVSGTDANSGTKLTREGSADVLRDLTVRRNRVGSESPEGRLLSTLIEQVRNYQKETDPTARAGLERMIGWTTDKIEQLRRTA